ncbi:MAG: XRE family transcriptional regulator [Magnetococcus sp. WYHC-3]
MSGRMLVTNLVGTRIRTLRTQRGLTQQMLAELAGIPRATLATMERDDANPTLSVVHRVAVALQVAVDTLIEESGMRIQVTRRGQMREVRAAAGAYCAVTVSPDGALHVTQQHFTLAAGGVHEGRPHTPGSEELLYILGGRMELVVAGEQVALETGDSARFRGNIAHRYINPGMDMAVAMVTILEGASRVGMV